MKKIIYAFRFLTILPIPWKQDEDLKKVARSVICFPLVGLAIGLILSFNVFFLTKHFSPLLTSILTVLIWILITGGLHLDGLSDLFDGLGGRTREDSLRIMKDSTIGAFGGLSLILLILLKVVIIRELILIVPSFLYVLMLSPIWARVVVLISIKFFKSARPDGMGNFFKLEMRTIDLLIPFILGTALLMHFLGYLAILILPMILIIILPFNIYISRRLGGLTGDCYGGICEISETLFLLISIFFISFGLI